VLTLKLDVDEGVDPRWNSAQIVQNLALRKARVAVTRQQALGALVIAADTIVTLPSGRVLGKPRDEHDARDMLTMLQGGVHEVCTGVACVEQQTGIERVDMRATRVYMKPLTAPEIDRYVASGEPMDKAGAYAIQGHAAQFITGIEGCYYNVVGLPLALLADMLATFGIRT
jgi:septum formation protein